MIINNLKTKKSLEFEKNPDVIKALELFKNVFGFELIVCYMQGNGVVLYKSEKDYEEKNYFYHTGDPYAVIEFIQGAVKANAGVFKTQTKEACITVSYPGTNESPDVLVIRYTEDMPHPAQAVICEIAEVDGADTGDDRVKKLDELIEGLNRRGYSASCKETLPIHIV